MVAELRPLIEKVWRNCEDKRLRGRTVTLKVKFNDFEIITRSRSVPAPISNRADLERMSISMLRNEMPVPKPVRLLGVSLSRCRATIGKKRNSASRFRAICMIGISRAGSMRSPVAVIGRFAFNFARNARGRAGNLYEAELYRRSTRDGSSTAPGLQSSALDPTGRGDSSIRGP